MHADCCLNWISTDFHVKHINPFKHRRKRKGHITQKYKYYERCSQQRKRRDIFHEDLKIMTNCLIFRAVKRDERVQAMAVWITAPIGNRNLLQYPNHRKNSENRQHIMACSPNTLDNRKQRCHIRIIYTSLDEIRDRFRAAIHNCQFFSV